MKILQRFLAYDYNYTMWNGICPVKIILIIKKISVFENQDEQLLDCRSYA